ncbi:hypothetical protein ABTX35_01550 [Streptomyces sp. NPDC096080]|uniref:hypothetical protein n=1 Tax=Streptomyces sp. NPDC096080 TaxID=3156693 RepID=UPI003324FA06
MSRLARPADRLARGTYLAARHRLDRTAAWIAKGRRNDLTGWKAALGCILRLLALLISLYLLARLIRALPALMWLLSGAWLVAAWRAGKPASAEPSEKPSREAPATAPGEALRTLLLEVMGEADAVHLATVLAHLQEKGHWRGRTVTDLRRRLAALGVPHDRSVKVAGVPTWGVRRKHLQEQPQTPSPAPPQETSPEASTAA